VKNYRNLAVDTNSSFLELAANAIKDMIGLGVDARSDLKAYKYESDKVDPKLSSWSINLFKEEAALIFNEPVDSVTFHANSLTFQTLENVGVTETEKFVKISGGSHTVSSDGLKVTLSLSRSDLNNLKKNELLLSHKNYSWISFEKDAVRDVSNNSIAEVPKSSAIGLEANQLVDDKKAPTVDSFALDMDSPEILTLRFNETMDVSTLIFANITLQKVRNAAEGDRHTLTGGTLVAGQEDSTVVSFKLDKVDVDEITRKEIADDANSVFLAMTHGTIKDMSGNPSTATDSEATVLDIASSDYTRDQTDPVLEKFDFDENSAELILYFSETVRALDLKVPLIRLQSKANNDTDDAVGVPLTSDSSVVLVDGTSLKVAVGSKDLNHIKTVHQLAVSNETTFISADVGFVKDMAGVANSAVARSSSDGLLVNAYKKDSTDPKLVAVELDMNKNNVGELILDFSETINRTSVVFTQIRLQASHNDTTDSFLLTDGQVNYNVDDPPTRLRVGFSKDDSNAIKANTNLAVKPVHSQLIVDNDIVDLYDLSAYVSMAGSASIPTIRDMAWNGVVEVSESEAKAVSHDKYTQDTTSPTLNSFVLDMNKHELRLEFDETVDASSVEVSKLTLQGKADTTGDSEAGLAAVTFKLTGVSSAQSEDSASIIVSIGESDANAIKERTGLGTVKDNTFLSFPNTALVDMSGAENEVNGVSVFGGKNATDVIKDEIDLSFANSRWT
jgi:hypothetical protein